MDIESILAETLSREIARELLSDELPIDEKLFEEAFGYANGNGYDANVIYRMLLLTQK